MTDGANIEVVTFDVGGTLIEPRRSVGHVYSEVAARHGVHVPAEVLDARFAAAWEAKGDFGHSLNDWSNLVDATFAGLVERRPSETFFPELYDEFAVPRAWQIFDDVIPCLETLQRMNKRLAVISNWDERLRPLLDRLNLTRFFEVIVVSIEVDVPKPDRKIFDAVTTQLNVEPSRILHVGDSPREDVMGARDAGFRAVLIRRDQPSVANEQVASLVELRNLV